MKEMSLLETSDLLKELASIFPDIDFSDVTSQYDQVEEKILDKLTKTGLTEEQWKAVLNSKYDILFQNGVPHLSWSTDRKKIAWHLIKNIKPSRVWSETWYKCEEYYIRDSVTIKVRVERPVAFSGGSLKVYVSITDQAVPVPTHRAVIIKIRQNTEAYIHDQFAGSESECEDWVSENIEPNTFFKILPL